ncbi:hypothetical protein A7982_12978 [Minicystis rosea]|nr:hypothetical protein A7982_12978 [Minicystis rosea]
MSAGLTKRTRGMMDLRTKLGRIALLAAAPILALACSTEPPENIGTPAVEPASQPVEPAPGELRFHGEPLTRIRFPVLATGVSVDERHYDPSLPAYKFKHSFRLATESGTVVVIDVWDDPARPAVRAWFDQHLAGLVDAETRVSERPMSRAHASGILLRQPRSTQALSQAIAVFAVGAQIFRVTAIDYEGNPAARRLFDEVVDKLEVAVTP